MRASRSSLIAGAVVVAAVLGACGSSDDATPTAGAKDCTTVTVEIGEFKFDPTPVKVHVCDSVVWKNVHDQAHTSNGNGAQTWGTGNIAAGTSSTPVEITTKGSLTYICALHPFMKGVVEAS